MQNVLDDVDGGGPQTILVIGSDKRYQDEVQGNPARSDTLILVRLNPGRERDGAALDPARPARRRSPATARARINAAYANGGAEADAAHGPPALRHPDPPHRRGQLRRLPPRRRPARMRLRGHRPPLLPLERRAAAVRRSTRRSTSSPATRSSAAPRRCEFVRFRHEDSDFVRAARQQDFLGQAKDQFGLSDDPRRPQAARRDLLDATRAPTSAPTRRSCASSSSPSCPRRTRSRRSASTARWTPRAATSRSRRSGSPRCARRS